MRFGRHKRRLYLDATQMASGNNTADAVVICELINDVRVLQNALVQVQAHNHITGCLCNVVVNEALTATGGK